MAKKKKQTHTADGFDGSNDAPADARSRLKSFIERIERLEEEKKTIAEDIKSVYGEAKDDGFDAKIMKKIIAIRKQDAEERQEQQSLLETYMIALGMMSSDYLEEVESSSKEDDEI